MEGRLSAAASAGANIAIIKHWGVRSERLRLPANSSLSLTLDNLRTTTTVTFDPDLGADVFVLNGRPAGVAACARVSAHLDRLRAVAGVRVGACVESENTFPMGAGLAASASGFAALTVAAAGALGLCLSAQELSGIARLGSGSAARSVFGGWVELVAARTHKGAVAAQVAPPAHWDVRDVIAIVSARVKPVSSIEGHRLARTSPFYEARLASLERVFEAAKKAVLERDFPRLGELAEADALSMHSVMMTSHPALLYWLPATVALLHSVRRWRGEGLACYFTIDAGPNVHVLTLPESAGEVAGRLAAAPDVLEVIACAPGEGARLIDASQQRRG